MRRQPSLDRRGAAAKDDGQRNHTDTPVKLGVAAGGWRVRVLRYPLPVLAAAGAIAPPKSVVHGHTLLEELLPGLAGRLGRGYLVEIGSTREKFESQGSTVVLATLAARLNLPFVTVDIDPENTRQAAADIADIPNARAVTAKGEDFLAAFDEPIVAAYLDAFDIQHGHHSEYRADRYRQFLGVEITNDRAAAMHLACARALIPRLVPGGLVVLDDTWRADKRFAGKGRDAAPEFLRAGFRVAGRTRTSIALQKEPPVRALLRRLRRAGRRSLQGVLGRRRSGR